MRRTLTLSLRVLVISLLLTSLGRAQITPPPQSPTLWSFLGVPQGLQKLKGKLANRRGKHPKLEPKPPLKALADLANLESPVAAIKKAAEIKAAEDLKPQKIKAIKYLAEIGCGCYDKDGSITDALIAASDDCTPDVRKTVVEQIHKAASGTCCSKCGETCCCNEKMVKRLAEMAYLRDESGCYVEPNAEVRAAAVKALIACCPDASPVTVIPDPDPYIPERGPQDDYVPESGPVRIPEGADDEEEKKKENEQAVAEDLLGARVPSWDGMVLHANQELGIAHVHLADPSTSIPVGTDLYAYGVVNGQQLMVGTLRVYQSFPGSVNVQAVNNVSRQAMVKGVAVLRDADTQVAMAPNLAVPQLSAMPRHEAAIPAAPVVSTAQLHRDPRYMSDSMTALVEVLQDTLDQ